MFRAHLHASSQRVLSAYKHSLWSNFNLWVYVAPGFVNMHRLRYQTERQCIGHHT